MLEMVGLVLTLTVLIYAVSKGMIGDLARPYVSMVWPARRPEITSSAQDDELAQNSTRFAVPPDTYQSEPRGIEVDNTDTILADEVAFARHLAGLRQPNGLHWLSANKIVSLVKLSRNDALAAVRSVRINEAEEPEPIDPLKMLRVRDGQGERLIPR